MSVERQDVVRLDLTQPLIWPNPVVMLAGAAPSIDLFGPYDDSERLDALRLIKGGVQASSSPTHPAHFNHCPEDSEGYPADLGQVPERPVWLLGAAAWILVAAASLAIAVTRLATPITRLGKGTRIA